MPLNRASYSRYQLIDSCLRRKQKPTLLDLQNYIQEETGKPISTKTIKLDIRAMRYDQTLHFEAPIVFDKFSYTYRYSDEQYSIHHLPISVDDLHGLEFALSILDQFKELPVIKEMEDTLQKIAKSVRIHKEVLGEEKYIHFDRPNSYKGIEYMEQLVSAIRQKKVIQFTYKSFQTNQEKEHLVEPYFIREFKNRFYLIGNYVSKKESKVLTYSLDRVVELCVTEKSFAEKKSTVETFYQHAFGVTVTDKKPAKVTLLFSPIQGKYILSQPLHSSQKILKSKEDGVKISIEVQVNRELIMQLLSYGKEVKVIEPLSLIKQIKEELVDALANY